MPNESDGFKITDEDMSRTLSSWQDDDYLQGMLHRQELDKNDRFMELMSQHSEERETAEAAKPGLVFEIPAKAQAELDSKRDEFDQVWDTEDAKSIPRTTGQLREELAAKGIRREPPTAEEVEAREQERLAHLRAVARTANHASEVHEKRTRRSKVVMRPKGSIQRDIRDADPRVKTDRELGGSL